MITNFMRDNYDPENDASRVTYWDMRLGEDIETLHGQIYALRNQVTNLEHRNASLQQRLAALEVWQSAMATDSAEDDTLFRIYDAIARRQRVGA